MTCLEPDWPPISVHFRITLKENASSDNTVRTIFSGRETVGYAVATTGTDDEKN